MLIEIPIESESCRNCNKCIIVCPDRLLVFDIGTEKVYSADDKIFDELEDRLSGTLLNLLKEEIHSDGIVSEDEKGLLKIITRNFDTFKKMMKVAEPILSAAKKFLFKSVWAEAIRDDIISQDEHAILDIICNKLRIDPKEQDRFKDEVDAETRAIKELRQKLAK
jgi:ferredoxin